MSYLECLYFADSHLEFFAGAFGCLFSHSHIKSLHFTPPLLEVACLKVHPACGSSVRAKTTLKPANTAMAINFETCRPGASFRHWHASELHIFQWSIDFPWFLSYQPILPAAPPPPECLLGASQMPVRCLWLPWNLLSKLLLPAHAAPSNSCWTRRSPIPCEVGICNVVLCCVVLCCWFLLKAALSISPAVCILISNYGKAFIRILRAWLEVHPMMGRRIQRGKSADHGLSLLPGTWFGMVCTGYTYFSSML